MAVVDTVTGEVMSPCSLDEARALTEQIKAAVEDVWDLITRAYVTRAWDAMCYSTWDEYCAAEFGAARLRLPSEERREIVNSLRDAGLSIRAISSATGAGKGTVERDLAGVPNGTPGREVVKSSPPDVTPMPKSITGTDGKAYAAATKPEPPKGSPEDLKQLGKTMGEVIEATDPQLAAEWVATETLRDIRKAVKNITCAPVEIVAQGFDDEDRRVALHAIDDLAAWLRDLRNAMNPDRKLRSV